MDMTRNKQRAEKIWELADSAEKARMRLGEMMPPWICNEDLGGREAGWEKMAGKDFADVVTLLRGITEEQNGR